jgi:hypothetical protein
MWVLAISSAPVSFILVHILERQRENRIGRRPPETTETELLAVNQYNGWRQSRYIEQIDLSVVSKKPAVQSIASLLSSARRKTREPNL